LAQLRRIPQLDIPDPNAWVCQWAGNVKMPQRYNSGRGRLQATLNKLASEGWKVRTEAKWDVNCIILAR
jgi:hypothetical protein